MNHLRMSIFTVTINSKSIQFKTSCIPKCCPDECRFSSMYIVRLYYCLLAYIFSVPSDILFLLYRIMWNHQTTSPNRVTIALEPNAVRVFDIFMYEIHFQMNHLRMYIFTVRIVFFGHFDILSIMLWLWANSRNSRVHIQFRNSN